MAILESSSDAHVKRLLELFPVANLRDAWKDKLGLNKEEICHEIAAAHDYGRIAAFVDANLNCCRQHVHVFKAAADAGALTIPGSIRDGEQVHSTPQHALYITRSVNTVVLKDPLEETQIEFLWPVRIELHDEYLVVRFVVLQKDLGAYVDRPYYVGDRGIDEKDVLADVTADKLEAADLHKGVKKLWSDGFMDAPRTKYKKPMSLASESMDEERGIREHNQDLYEVLVDSPLYQTQFKIDVGKQSTVEVFFVDPSRGVLTFPRYAEKGADTDSVIQQILSNNQ